MFITYMCGSYKPFFLQCRSVTFFARNGKEYDVEFSATKIKRKKKSDHLHVYVKDF